MIKKMSYIKTNGPIIILGLLYIWVFIFTLFNIYFEKNWETYLLITYGIIILFTLFLIYKRLENTKKIYNNIEEFEKTLKGGLFHFKCPSCKGVFAIKKSKNNNKKTVKMTCPDCGIIGIIPPHPLCIEEEIPEKKSIKENFKCLICGEKITVWAEGTNLYEDIKVFSCPFCGIKKQLKKI
jgi:predicted RNA-binding Zn-ribbon protein involved in translation (DUF1610 family)